MNEATVTLNCIDFPGVSAAKVGWQSKQAVLEPVPGDSVTATFQIPVKVKEGKDGGPDFFGPNVFGKVGDRFLYLVWFIDGPVPERFRRAKIKLNHLTWAETKAGPKATITMTDAKGGPICATVRPQFIQWG